MRGVANIRCADSQALKVSVELIGILARFLCFDGRNYGVTITNEVVPEVIVLGLARKVEAVDGLDVTGDPCRRQS